MVEPTEYDRAPFRYEYDPPVVRCGSGVLEQLSTELSEHGLERAVVVCGQTVGATPVVIDPVVDGLGDRLAGVFDETTPEKRLETAWRARERVRELEADVVVSLGGGSSLDVATVAAVLAGSDRPLEDVADEFARRRSISVPEADLPAIVAIPTTLAGADLSAGAGLTATPESGLVEGAVHGGVSDPRLMPVLACYDPGLVATTPSSILAASAINGFDKGIETLYARTATPITDATAMRGLSLLQDGLLAMGETMSGGDLEAVDDAVFDTLVRGLILVQYGINRPDASTLSIVHAFGHGLSRPFPVQQGAAHAVVLPHVLEYLFERVDARRDLLAAALGVTESADRASAVVDAVSELVETLDLPTRLRDVDGPDPDGFDAVAETILDDHGMANAPPGVGPTREEIVGVLEAAW